jgi:hypothetical protein
MLMNFFKKKQIYIFVFYIISSIFIIYVKLRENLLQQYYQFSKNFNESFVNNIFINIK